MRKRMARRGRRGDRRLVLAVSACGSKKAATTTTAAPTTTEAMNTDVSGSMTFDGDLDRRARRRPSAT